ncbi:hypothetical protein RIF29_23470 [Crotalaria pallida]|uniref:Uncharacterized protein n=1 Tax=Crotalaria pallida TaxID=3830 RepID=A0AAN9F8A5_CROPI
MGLSSQPSLVSLSLKDMLRGTAEEPRNSSSSYGYLWSKVLAAKKSVKGRKRPRRILMKRRNGSGRGVNGIRRRVRTLRRLVPNSDSNKGLDGLFRETADYILALQTRVRVMHVMVNVLSGSSSDE